MSALILLELKRPSLRGPIRICRCALARTTHGRGVPLVSSSLLSCSSMLIRARTAMRRPVLLFQCSVATDPGGEVDLVALGVGQRPPHRGEPVADQGAAGCQCGGHAGFSLVVREADVDVNAVAA